MFETLHEQIRTRLEKLLPGQVVVISDFDDIAEPKTVSKILQRLCDSELVHKLTRGMFWKKAPQKEAPSVKELADGIARQNGWHIVPTGETALYVVGLSDEEPEEWAFISDGTNRSYSFGETVLTFRHAAARYVNSLSEKTAALIQALKSLGQNAISPEQLLDAIKRRFDRADFAKLAEEAKKAPAWIASLLIAVCSLYENLL